MTPRDQVIQRSHVYVHTELMGFTPLLELNKASLSYLIRLAIGAKLDCTPGRVNPFHTLRGVHPVTYGSKEGFRNQVNLGFCFILSYRWIEVMQFGF